MAAMGLHCELHYGRWEISRTERSRPAIAVGAEGRSFQLLPQLWVKDARLPLQNGVQDLRLLSELQRLLLKTMASGDLISSEKCFEIEHKPEIAVMQIVSPDGTNKLGLSHIVALHLAVEELTIKAEKGNLKRLIITGSDKFSAGADLNEISQLSAAQAFEFSRRGQALMLAIDHFPVLEIAAIRGYCMGGGMDLALACDRRIAAPNAVFGHRGASLGVMTGWGGTQRLPRLIGKPRAMQMFLLAEMVKAEEALRIGLVDEIVDDPVAHARRVFSGVHAKRHL
jgi:enoyl-CoA hydratase